MRKLTASFALILLMSILALANHLTPAQLAALRAELNTDPTVRGYAPHIASGSLGQVERLINERSAAAGMISREGEPVHRDQVMDAITGASFDGLTTAESNRLTIVLGGEYVDIGKQSVQDKLLRVFSGTGTERPITRTNIQTLKTRPASRAEMLFGINQSVDQQDIIQALALP